MTTMTKAAARAKRSEIMDRIAAAKGTTRQDLEQVAIDLAGRVADVCDGTFDEAIKIAEKMWCEHPTGGIAWDDVEAELRRLYQ